MKTGIKPSGETLPHKKKKIRERGVKEVSRFGKKLTGRVPEPNPLGKVRGRRGVKENREKWFVVGYSG